MFAVPRFGIHLKLRRKYLLGLLLLIFIGVGGGSYSHYSRDQRPTKNPTIPTVATTTPTIQNNVTATQDSQVQPNPQPPSEEPKQGQECKPSETQYISVKEGVRLRTTKKDSSSYLSVVPYRTAIIVGCSDGSWVAAEYKGKTGYIRVGYLSTTQPQLTTAASNPTANANPTPQIPFQISEVTTTVSPSSSASDPVKSCNTNFVFVGNISATAAGRVQYAWEFNDGTSVPGIIDFGSAGKQTVLYNLNVNTTKNGWAKLHVISPDDKTSNSSEYYFTRNLICL